MPKKIIIDCDTGVDDAQAIMLAVTSAEDVNILAITCVNGNVNVDQVCLNTLRVLKVCQNKEIPVHRGCDSPLLYRSSDASVVHSTDGLGGIPDTDPPDSATVQSEHAVSALVRLAKENKGDVTLVALGPLTNIAMALRMYPNFGSNLKEAIIMGGNIEGRGNVTTTGEFNFYTDPEAAYITLNDLRCPIKLLAWEPCLSNGFDWEWYDSLHKSNSAISKFHAAITQKFTYRKKEVLKLPQYYSCDPVAILVAMYPLCVVESQNHYCSVELKGELTRGQMVVDWRRALGKEANVEIVTKVDIELMKTYFEKMLL